MAEQELVTSSENSLTREEIALGLLYPMPPQMSEDEIIGLVEAVGTRSGSIPMQKVAIRLAQGWSRSMAVLGSGISAPQLQRMCQKHPAAADILQQLEDAGFARRWEGELYSRAEAGKDDRGSLRALEMLLKARNPQYQEKSALNLHVMNAAERSIQGANAAYEQLQEAGQFS